MHPFLLSVQWNVLVSTPLYTHWRHGSVSGVREGCSFQGPFCKDDEAPVFCSFNAEIEAHLQYLHSQLRVGRRHYQSEIDRYLVACRGPRYQHLILPRGRAPHYDNLPDFSHHALAILDPSRDHIVELQQLFLLLRQCTPLRRRTKRAQRELQWEAHSLQGMQHLVQCMQGTLLGLYPTCARAVAFVTRVHAYAFLRSLLVSPFETLNAYLQRIRYILKICVMEHLCNTIIDYHPGICHMLNKSGQQLQHFCHAVTTMCDIFRSDLNLHFVQNGCIVGTMLHLEKSAHSFFERCTRAYRGIITGQSPGFSSLELFRKKALAPSMRFMRLLSSVYSAPNQYIFDIVHKDLLPEDVMEPFWHLTQCITVHALPVVITQRQQAALARRYPQVLHHVFTPYVLLVKLYIHCSLQDTICIQRCRRIHVCLYCATKRNLTGGQLQCAKLRMDCTQSADSLYLCANCNLASILQVDVLGRIAHIGDQKLLLSSCCASLIYYRGSGYEFNTSCGPQCVRDNQFSKGRTGSHSNGASSHSKRSAVASHHGLQPLLPSLCFVCNQKNIVHSFQLLHAATRAIKTYHLCSKHNLNIDIIKQLDDEYDLFQALRCNQRIA